MIGRGVAYGAVSIVNALCSGRGVTLGIQLKTSAKVYVEKKKGTWSCYVNGTEYDSRLPVEVVRVALSSMGKDPSEYSGRIETDTELPIGVGLKSSSSSSCAIAEAVYSAFEKNADLGMILRLSADASISAGASITGAMDDSASCIIGGMNFVDNISRNILRSKEIGKEYYVLIILPPYRSRRPILDIQEIKKFEVISDSLFRMAMQGQVWEAMTLNGLLCSSLIGYETSHQIKALQNGAISAGLSGTGPAVAAVYEPSEEARMKKAEQEFRKMGCNLIITRTREKSERR